jgi:hypothetical protein
MILLMETSNGTVSAIPDDSAPDLPDALPDVAVVLLFGNQLSKWKCVGEFGLSFQLLLPKSLQIRGTHQQHNTQFRSSPRFHLGTDLLDA